MNRKAKNLATSLSPPKAKSKKPNPKDMLSTGSTLLNLAIAGIPNAGAVKGSYVYFVGDSDAGKTWVSIMMLAEASINKSFDDYQLVYDSPEGGAQMDIAFYFGQRLAKRIQGPKKGVFGPNNHSVYLEDFYFNLDDCLAKGPCVYVVDSMDALISKDEDKKFETVKKEHRAEKESTGSMQDGKPKVNSKLLRKVITKIKKTGSILILISQTRDNIGFGAKFKPKTRSGGHALTFYADIEVWLRKKSTLSKTVKGKSRVVGTMSKVNVTRSRITGKKAELLLPIYNQVGVDEVGSMVEWLVDEGYWKGNSDTKTKTITAPEFDFKGKTDTLIKKIEDEELELDLKLLVAEVWDSIEDASIVRRKRRYE